MKTSGTWFNMAAPSGLPERASSSSDDGDIKKCREAVWETQVNKRKDEDSRHSARQSKRVVADHEHDGSQLQVTTGFQTHVATKLEQFLDSCISELQSETSHGLESTNRGHDNQDEGFRLFSTSVPGQKADHPPAPARRRPAPSSSDSDSEMEMRLKEAAVPLKDLFPSTPTTETPGSETMLAHQVEKEGEIIKKKRKRNDEESEHVDSAGSAPDHSSGERRSSELEHARVQVERKKKEKRKEAEFL
ncbi:protein CUSTOS isoform X2 [Nematolebias whitei]|uniref:protein CUSTOS isoform X2 n=1 Tax=Nematolebias whitei TaxID=451745 RepID=UPI001898EA45|nr:protein CUSTOS isoform X2 [Nematolebias whitei]